MEMNQLFWLLNIFLVTFIEMISARDGEQRIILLFGVNSDKFLSVTSLSVISLSVISQIICDKLMGDKLISGKLTSDKKGREL